ncbi:hypothetical protein COU61_03600 [Candidatus Pacearchaeota archaeon CG10_big_fil_rev_8_21_14_0_10_35_13]|nr:MAG: hypothetical protein COU61_03600 [Candidatus Pacearchaeota archaeon CG10_big_fil_rev_8_21_14_0_10_35_13]
MDNNPLGKKKKELMEYFYDDPIREYHIRELAKITDKSPTTISKMLKILVNKGILLQEEKLNHILFRANTDNKHYKISKLAYNLQRLEDSGVISYLENYYETPEAIVLFGSWSRADDVKESDIDILVVSAEKKLAELKAYEKKLSREVQLFVHTKNEMKKLVKTNKELLNSWANGIVLRGFLEVLYEY